MHEILKEWSKPFLVKAIEENLLAFHSYFRGWSRSEGQTGPSLKWSITDIPFPMFNNILGCRLNPEESDREIDAAIARGRSRNVPLLWFTGPSTLPADLGTHLTAHGFAREDDSPGMAANLDQLPNLTESPNLKITPVTNPESLKTWCDTAVVGYGMPEFVGPAFLDWFSSFPLNSRAQLRHYIAWWNGSPAAVASVLLAAGVAGIYNVTTLAGYRGRGIGSAVTLAPLLEARKEGYKVGVLQSTARGLSVYRKLGFKEYCSIGAYVWVP